MLTLYFYDSLRDKSINLGVYKETDNWREVVLQYLEKGLSNVYIPSYFRYFSTKNNDEVTIDFGKHYEFFKYAIDNKEREYNLYDINMKGNIYQILAINKKDAYNKFFNFYCAVNDVKYDKKSEAIIVKHEPSLF